MHSSLAADVSVGSLPVIEGSWDGRFPPIAEIQTGTLPAIRRKSDPLRRPARAHRSGRQARVQNAVADADRHEKGEIGRRQCVRLDDFEAPRFSAGDFLFNAPLYTAYTVTPADVTQLLEQPVDGYCLYCHKPSTFTSPASDAAAKARLANALRGTVVGNGNFSRAQDILCQQDKLTITCARSQSHSVQFVFRLEENMQLQKIGQFPSLADIAIGLGRCLQRLGL
jgi:hypothetical protein